MFGVHFKRSTHDVGYAFQNTWPFHVSRQYNITMHMWEYFAILYMMWDYFTMHIHGLFMVWEYFTMHIILDFVLCWFYEWPVMQISNASFPHSAGRHPVLMTRICLRPERVHDSVTIRNSDFQLLYTSLHCLSWRPCGGITIVKAMVRQTQIWPYYGFSCFFGDHMRAAVRTN